MKKSLLFIVLFVLTFSVALLNSEVTDRYLSSSDVQMQTGGLEIGSQQNSRVFSAPENVIFSQLPHNPGESWSFATSEVEPGYNVAENFWGLAGKPIDGIRFWGLSLTNPWAECGSENPMELEFTFYQDDAGTIGSIENQFIATPTMITTGDIYLAYQLYEFEVDFPNSINMDEGWLSIQGQTADPNCWFLWSSSASGDGDSYQYNDGWGYTVYDRGMCLTMGKWGSITEDTEWCDETIYVGGDIVVEEGVTLTICPGTEVVFLGHHHIDVRGTLIADGTIEGTRDYDEILFTAEDPEGWEGIIFDNVAETSDPSVLRYCTLEYGVKTNLLMGDDNPSYSTDEWSEQDWVDHYSNNRDRECPWTYEYAGGAIHIYSFSDLLIDNCTFQYNEAYTGGAIFMAKGSSPTISNCNFYENDARSEYHGWHDSGSGGAIMVGGWVNNPIITDCEFERNEAEYQGGAIFFGGASMGTIERCSFQQNDVECSMIGRMYGYGYGDGGAIKIGGLGNVFPGGEQGMQPWHVDPDARFDIHDNHFYKNYADADGGAIKIGGYHNQVYMNNNVFDFNESWADGGAIKIAGNGTNVVMKNNTLIGNWAIFGDGGGFKIAGEGTNMFFEGDTLYSNGAGDWGYWDVEYNRFVDYDEDYDGGAFMLSGWSNTIVKNCVIDDNCAWSSGGAFAAEGHADFDLINCLVTNNWAWGENWGFYRTEDDQTSPPVQRISERFGENFAARVTARTGDDRPPFYGNKQSGQGGAGRLGGNADVSIISTTFTENYADSIGGCFFIGAQCDVEILSSIIWGNNAGYAANEIFEGIAYGPGPYIDSGEDRSILYFDFTIVDTSGWELCEGGYWDLTQHINEIGAVIPFDPLFADPGNGDYTLLIDSPGINTGLPDTTGFGIPELDLKGDPRVFEGNLYWRIDTGCYEYQQDPENQYVFDGFFSEYPDYDYGDNSAFLCADTVFVYGNVYIPPNYSVVICPGTVVLQRPALFETRAYGDGWMIDGCLFAVGTETERIIFTADDPIEGWSGIWFDNLDNNFYTSRLKYCDVEYVNNLYNPMDNREPYAWTAAVTAYNSSNFRISECEFRYNKGTYGGAIALLGDCYPYIQDNLFNYNLALGGGGIFANFTWDSGMPARPIVVDSTLTIANNEFVNNFAVAGGAMYLMDTPSEYTNGFREETPGVEIHDNIIHENIALGNVGLVDMDYFLGEYFDVEYEGGYPFDFLQIERIAPLMVGYRQEFGLGYDISWTGGGGIFSLDLEPVISSNEITENISLGDYSDFDRDEDARFDGIFTHGLGGAISLIDMAEDIQFRDQGILKPVIDNNTISGNDIYLNAGRDAIWVLIYNNMILPPACGGGIFSMSTYPQIINNGISENVISQYPSSREDYDMDKYQQHQENDRYYEYPAFGWSGNAGGIYCVLMDDYGEGLEIEEEIPEIVIQSNKMLNNLAYSWCAGITVERGFDYTQGEQMNNERDVDNDMLYITNNLIVNDEEYDEDSYWAEGILVNGINPMIVNNTCYLYENYHQSDIFDVMADSITIKNNIFWGDGDAFINSVYWYIDEFNYFEITHNDVKGYDQWENRDYIFENNIDAYPEFALTGDHPYMLVDNSPCANAGDPAITMANLADWYLPEVDLKGADRIYEEMIVRDGIIDIGAYEVGNNPPYDIALGSPGTIPENEAPGYLVGQLTTEDLDELDTHTYSLVPGEGDDFNDCFEIIGDELFTTCELNYEDLLNPVRGTIPFLSAEKSNERKGEIDLNTGTENTRPVLPNAWINEFHYDNVSTDIGEFIEVIVQNDTRLELSGLTLTLYNGSNGEVYNIESMNNFSLISTLGEYSFYVWTLPSNGIQNGGPDGLCLDYYGNVIEFLSYESSPFIAVEGPASGMTSTDIGVSESSSTPVGHSLQLTDPGRYSYSYDYVWYPPMAETPGFINTGQTLDQLAPTVGVTVRVRSTDDGENNMYVEKELFIPVIDKNDDPLFDIIPEEFTFDEDGSSGPIDFDPFIHDEDVDGVRVVNNLTLEVSGNTNVIVDITDLVVTFTAVEDWFGEEMLTFTVNDGWARAIASDSVLVVVGPIDDEPEINVPDSLWATIFSSNEDGPIVFDFGPYISQAWGETDDVILTCVGQFPGSIPEMDEINVVINGFVVTFTPQENQFGMMIVDFMVSDGITRIINDKIKKDRTGEISISSGSDNNRIIYETIHVTFEPVNDPPILDVPIVLEAMEDDSSEVYDFTPYISQTWGEFDPVTLTSAGSAHIDVFIDGFDVVIASNTLNWSGEEDIVFTVDDSIYTRLASTEIVHAIIHGYNDPPVLGFIDVVSFPEDTTYDITATATDVDTDQGDLVFDAYVQSGNLSVSVDGADVTITPDPDWYGEGSIVVKVFDGMWYDQQLVLVTVTNVNDAPLLELPESFTFMEDGELVVDFFPFITDADDLSSRLDNYTIELIGTPADIDVAIDGTEVTFGTVLDNWSGTEMLTFVVNDNVSSSRTGKNILSVGMNSRDISPEATVDIIVTAENDAPYVMPAAINSIEFMEDTIYTGLDLDDMFGDPDLIYGDVLTYSAELGFYTGIEIEIDVDNVVTITPVPDWNGMINVTFMAEDMGGLIAEHIVEVTVTPDNDGPVFDLPEELSFHEGGILVTNFLQYVTDVDGDDLTLTMTSEPLNIHVDQSLWALEFTTVEENWNGSESITFTVSDGIARAIATDTVIITVIPENDPPAYIGTTLVTVNEDFEGVELIGDLDDMFEDVEDDLLTFTLDFYNPEMLTATLDEENNLSITSVLNACGNTSVVVTASDGEYEVQQAISVLILAENDPPQLVNLPEHIEMGAYSNMILNLDDCWLDVDDIPTMMIIPADDFIEVSQLEGYDYRFRLNALHIAGMEDIITVMLFDGVTQVEEDITVTVAESEAPIITFLIPNLVYAEDFALTQVVDLDQCFEDPEGMPLTFGAYEVGGMGYLEVVVDEENVLYLGSGTENWNGEVCVDVWASDASTRTITTQTINIEVMPVNDPPYLLVESLPEVILDEDFGVYTVVDYTTIFADVDDPVEATAYLTGDPVVSYEHFGTEVALLSLPNIWGETSMVIVADDGHGSRASVSIGFDITINPVYDHPTFDPALDGMEFQISMDGEVIDFSPWVETYGQVNSIPMNIVLPGEDQYYEVDNVNGMIYGLFAYPLGHQWAFPDQECQLWLDGGSHVTIILQTDLPEVENYNQVFFSEYTQESPNNNRAFISYDALEIFNNTGYEVNLNCYRIRGFFNGNDGYVLDHYFPQDAVLADQDVWVMINNDLSEGVFDHSGADEVLNTGIVTFTGNDFLNLQYTPDGGQTWIPVDGIGNYGPEVVMGWGVAGIPFATFEHTLYRKESVTCGNMNWIESAGTNAENSEWEVSSSVWIFLGSHPNVVLLANGQIPFEDTFETRGSEDTPVYSTDLIGNHPNPFNPDTNIEFSLAETERAVVTIYNIKGEVVRTLADEVYPAGVHSVHWNGKDDSGSSVSSGVYFYKLEAGATSKLKKMMLLQ